MKKFKFMMIFVCLFTACIVVASSTGAFLAEHEIIEGLWGSLLIISVGGFIAAMFIKDK